MLKIGIISDIHNDAQSRKTIEGVLEDVVDRFNQEFSPDQTVVMGDLIEDTGSRRDDINLIREVTSILDSINGPVQYMAGNHDPVSVTQGELRTIYGNDLYGTASVGSRRLIFLDSSAPHLEGPRGEVDQPQITWLDQFLQSTESATVFVHHPIHYCDLSDNHWFDRTPERAFCGTKHEINNILKNYDAVDSVFSGHIHETHHVSVNGIEHISVNAFNKVLPDELVTGTHAEVTIQNNTLTIEFFERCEPVEEFSIPL